ncbi:MAG: DMT family transporter [Alphaproteobacteria bacterium]
MSEDTPSTRKSGYGAQSPAIQAAIIATVAMVLFSVVPPSVRLLSDTMSSWQIVFIRAAFGAVGIGLYFVWTGVHKLKSRQMKIHIVRSTFNFVGMVMWFWALAHIELAKGIAIHFTMPLFIALLAVIFLKERIGPWRITAMLAGFGGVLIILRPGAIETGLPELAILGSAALYGGAVVFLKKVVADETPAAVTFYTNLFMALGCLIPTIVLWTPMTAADILPILGLGVCGLFAPFMVAVALRKADASLIAAFDFLRLPFTALFGFVLFAEIPDEFVWIGAAVIFASTYFIARREARKQNQSQ